MVSWLTLLSLPLLAHSAWASVLAIDYGTDWTKASLMKPGVPFDVLLNKDSKRKIHASVGWNRDDRLFSTDAFNIATRFPQDSFPSLKHIIGSQYSSNKTWYYSQVGQGVMLETDRGTVALERTHGGKSTWTVEELIGMQLAYIRSLAEETAGERVTDLVLTVPAFFSHAERQALLDAVEIGGMRALALINDGSAVAVNYAMTRTFPEKEHHIIFDAGAGSVRAAVASFFTPDAPAPGSTKKASKLKNPTKESANVEILGFGWNTTPSGNELTRRLRDKFIAEFEKKHGFSIATDGRARARLWKEAERVKGILSANADARTTVESLANDIDFKTTTSRADFEASSEDLKEIFGQPIVDALESSGLEWENITSVILMGGHSRVPMVQAAVRAISGDVKISQNINTDEAAVLGAAFYGASLSRQFRTKKIKLQDISTHDIQTSYETEGKNGKRTIHTLIFPKFSKLGVKKTLSFKRKEDFSLQFSYKTPENTPEFPQAILNLQISNVTEAVANLTSRGATDPVVKLTLQLLESGLISVSDAVAFGEVKDDSIAGKLKGFFGGGSSSSSSSSGEPTSTDSAGTASTTAAAPSETPVVDAKKDQKNYVPVITDIEYLSIRPLTEFEKNKSRTRLLALDMAEKAQEEKAEAINQLEAYVYRVRDLLSEAETSETMFKEFSTDAERAHFKQLLEETADWLHVSGSEADTKTLKAKRQALEALETPIQGRHKEFDAISAAIKDLNQALDAARLFHLKAQDELERATAPLIQPIVVDESAQAPLEAEEPAAAPSASTKPEPKYTPEELEEVNTAIKDTEAWLKEKLESVAGSPKNIDAPFRAIDIDQKGVALQRLVKRLTNKRPAVKPKKEKKSKTTTSTSSSSSTSASSAAPEQETAGKRDEL